MADDSEKPGPARRLLSAVLPDLKAALIGLGIVSAGGISVVLRKNHIEMRAWVFAAIIAVLLTAGLILYDLLVRKAGQLQEVRRLETEARSRVEELSSEPRPSPRSRELVRLMDALNTSIERRLAVYPTLQGHELEQDERDRFSRICQLTRYLLADTASVDAAITALESNGLGDAAACLGALDELKARVEAFGERDEDDGPLRSGGTSLVLDD